MTTYSPNMIPEDGRQKKIRYTLIALGIAVIILLILACGCSPKIVPVSRDTVNIVTTEYKEVLRDTTIYIEMPRDCVAIQTKDTASRIAIKQAISEASVSGGILSHSLSPNPSYKPEVIVKYKDIIRTRDSLVYVNKETAVEVNRLTAMQSFWVICGKILCSIIVVIGIWIAVKKFVIRV